MPYDRYAGDPEHRGQLIPGHLQGTRPRPIARDRLRIRAQSEVCCILGQLRKLGCVGADPRRAPKLAREFEGSVKMARFSDRRS